jgi:hypothetical protein
MVRLIDIRTLCFASSAAVCAVALAMTYVQRRRWTYAGFGHWVLSAWCGALGTALVGGRGLLPDALSVVLANLLLFGSMALLVTGLQAFTGTAPRTGAYLGLAGAATGLLSVFIYALPSLRTRVALFSFVAAGLCLRATHLAWRRLPRVLANANGLLRAVLGLIGITFLLRGLAMLVVAPPSEDFLTPGLSPLAAMAMFLAGQTCAYAALLVVNAQRVERDLQVALDECKVLRGLLPICATCKKIRDAEGAWSPLELYLRQHSEAEFTHGICPDCAAAFRREAASA